MSMTLRMLLPLVFTFVVVSSMISAQVATCTVSRDRIQLSCPNGWTVLTESENETTIGNYTRPPDTPKNVFGGPGKAWISFRTLPRLYRNLDEWIFAGTKNAPEAVRTSSTVRNNTFGEVKVTCLESPQKPGTLYYSCYFKLGKTAALLELTYGADDPRKAEYRSATLRTIETGAVAK